MLHNDVKVLRDHLLKQLCTSLSTSVDRLTYQHDGSKFPTVFCINRKCVNLTHLHYEQRRQKRNQGWRLPSSVSAHERVASLSCGGVRAKTIMQIESAPTSASTNYIAALSINHSSRSLPIKELCNCALTHFSKNWQKNCECRTRRERESEKK